MCILVVTRAKSILKCYWFCFLKTVLTIIIIIIANKRFTIEFDFIWQKVELT